MATSLPLPELVFVSPKRLFSSSSPGCLLYRVPFSRTCRFRVLRRTKLRAVREDGVVAEERENELIKEVNGYGLGSNGAAYNGNGDYRYNGWVNGGVTTVESETGGTNGNLVKYVNGNGVAAAVVGEIQASESVEEDRKKRIEEIGKEEAWFKRSDQQQVEVCFSACCSLLTYYSFDFIGGEIKCSLEVLFSSAIQAVYAQVQCLIRNCLNC